MLDCWCDKDSIWGDNDSSKNGRWWGKVEGQLEGQLEVADEQDCLLYTSVLSIFKYSQSVILNFDGFVQIINLSI